MYARLVSVPARAPAPAHGAQRLVVPVSGRPVRRRDAETGRAARHREELAVVAVALLGPHLGDGVDELVPALLGVVRVRLEPAQLVLLGPGTELRVSDAAPGTRFLLMTGQPYGELPAFNGPFVD